MVYTLTENPGGSRWYYNASHPLAHQQVAYELYFVILFL